jgi:hypothetical protein
MKKTIKTLFSLALLTAVSNVALADDCCSGPVRSYAPYSLMGTHLHQEGEYMFGYMYMYGEMSQPLVQAAPADDHHHMMGASAASDRHADMDEHEMPIAMPTPAPASKHQHTMQHSMHMIEGMYGVTDDFNLMGVVPIVSQEMNHNLGGATSKTVNSGIGDISLTALHSLYRADNRLLHGGLGMSFPTADINDTDVYHGKESRHPYMMQIGSGTYDLLPSLTYQAAHKRFGWGMQAISTIRLGTNNNSYALGDKYDIHSWVGYEMTQGLQLTTRLSGRFQTDASGRDEGFLLMTSAMGDPSKQAYALLEGGVGFSYAFQAKALRGNSAGIEVSFPISQNVDAGWMNQDWALTAGWRLSF